MHATTKALLDARAHKTPVPLSKFAELTPSRDGALAVQREVAADLGEVGAWKVAVTPDGEALFAPIFAPTIKEDGAVFSEGSEKPIGVEIELAFRLCQDLPELPEKDEDLIAAIDGLYAVIELIDSRLEDMNQASLDLKLADYLSNAGFIVGEKIETWDPYALTTVDLKLVVNDETVIDGSVTNVLGAPLDLLKGAVKAAGDHCGGFKAGQYVTTGSLSGCVFYPAGSKVTAKYPALKAAVSATL
ncbi:hypothetical protein PUV47_14570 [Pseudovibrio exalbescens]|uniref:fumarylacetoacetate hydrolase family protein n=1 Tax=Pseudovibrio exalbescens TaxID=197461 RepID=UPI0023673B98|nr:fumarylacetoacetate hydrolase family protein [Pseudovibrio exalbescens]MDD7911149.1 hypothetical protein [Pseudovibrio exalbescens]